MRTAAACRIFFVLIFSLPGLVQPGEDTVGTTSANFLKIPVNARPAAMGEAYSALSDDEAGLGYNPAGLASALQGELSATHIEWFQSIRLEHLGGIFSLGRVGTAGLSLTWLQVDSLARTERTGSASSDPEEQFRVIGQFAPHDMALNASYAWPLSPDWLVGGTLKLLQQEIASNNGYGASLDLGAQYLGLLENLKLGLVLHQLGTPIAVGNRAYGLPLTMNLGALYAIARGRVNAVLETSLPTDNKVQSGAGLEGWLYDVVALRAGYRFGYLNSFTAGLGLRAQGLRIDYAFVPYGELGYTHRVSASLAFGAPNVGLSAAPILIAPAGFEPVRASKLIPWLSKRDQTKAWSIVIKDAFGAKARTLSGDGAVPREIPWDGKDEQGRICLDGVYQARLSVAFPGVESSSPFVGIEVDARPPDISLDAEPKIIKPDNQTGAILVPVNFKLAAVDKHGVGAWALEIKDDQGRLFREFKGEGPQPPLLTWDGSNGAGDFVDTGKIYTMRLKACDSLGNWGEGPPFIQVVMFREIHLTISDKLLFDVGKAKLKAGTGPDMEKMARYISKFCSLEAAHADIIGHTDNRPINTAEFPDNIALSQARADALVKMLIEYFSIDPRLLRAVGKGESEPLVSNDTDEGRATNRRVEMIIHAVEYK